MIKIKNKKPTIRKFSEIKKVVYDKNWLKKNEDFPVYYIFRNIKQKNGLRYDITVIPPKLLGKEFIKTKGHCHKDNFKEIYKVLSGRAIFLLQKTRGKEIIDVYAIKAKKNDTVIIPGDYHHLTINPSKKETLILANWISKKCKNDYKYLERMNGACYFFTTNGWKKNKNYKKIPKIRFEKASGSFPKNLDFLKKAGMTE